MPCSWTESPAWNKAPGQPLLRYDFLDEDASLLDAGGNAQGMGMGTGGASQQSCGSAASILLVVLSWAELTSKSWEQE